MGKLGRKENFGPKTGDKNRVKTVKKNDKTLSSFVSQTCLKIQKFIYSIQEHKPQLCVKLLCLLILKMTIIPAIRPFFLLALISIAIGQPQKTNIGVCTQSVGEVQRKGNVRTGHIRKGESIYHGDKITTGKNAFISFLILEDRSVVKIFDNSVVKIFSDKKPKKPKTEVAIFGGRVSAEINKKKNREFIVNTPVSIASVKGTYFLAEHRTMDHHGPHHQGISDCVFSVMTGLLEVENTVSGKSVLVKDGKTVISLPDGDFQLFDTTDEFINHYKEPE